MKNIFITRKIPEVAIELLKTKNYNVTVSEKDEALTKEELIDILKNNSYDALVTLLNDKIDREVLEACPSVKVIANFAVGFNNIDVETAKEKNIFVTCCRGTSAQAVAQHVVALILAVFDRVIEGDQLVRKQEWLGWDPDLLMGTDLYGKTLGLVGSGNIGRIVAETLHKGFNCKILYTDLNQNVDLEKDLQAKKVSLEELLKESDIVSLHVPLLKETTHLINSENLKLMKPTSILINTARGPVVDEAALTQALKEKIILGAGLDVFEFEPKVSQELRNLQNVVFSPHIASAKESARIEMATLVAENVISVLEKNIPLTPAITPTK